MSTDIAEDFMTNYFDLMIRFDQRHIPTLFLFAPIGDTSRNIPNSILSHRLADGIYFHHNSQPFIATVSCYIHCSKTLKNAHYI